MIVPKVEQIKPQKAPTTSTKNIWRESTRSSYISHLADQNSENKDRNTHKLGWGVNCQSGLTNKIKIKIKIIKSGQNNNSGTNGVFIRE